MKFAEIIREAGINPEGLPNLSQIPILVYDRKNRLISDETIHFAEPLFEKNPKAGANFLNFCVYLERKIQSGEIHVSFFHPTVQVTESAVLVKYDSTSPDIFLRHP